MNTWPPDHNGAISLNKDRHSTISPISCLEVGTNTPSASQKTDTRVALLSAAIDVKGPQQVNDQLDPAQSGYELLLPWTSKSHGLRGRLTRTVFRW